MPEPFSSARIKQRRAKAHFDSLYEAVKGFGNTKPYDVQRAFHDDGLGYTVVVVPIRSIEPEQEQFAGLVGDIASNARAALDHTIYELALIDTVDRDPDDRARVLRFAQFPIFDDPTEFAGKNGKGPGVIGMLSEPHRTFIKTLQPFADEEAKGLSYLHAINNQDKHRIVHIVGMLPTNFGTNLAPATSLPGLEMEISTLGVGVIDKDPAPLVSVRFNQIIPKKDMAVHGREWELSAQICFDAGSDGVAGEVVGVTCLHILQSLDWALNKIEGAYGTLISGH